MDSLNHALDGGEAVRLSLCRVSKGLHGKGESQDPHAHSHRRAALWLRRSGLCSSLHHPRPSEGPCTTTHQRKVRLAIFLPRPYVCKTCGATFLRSSTLKIHNRRHTGERPYVCSHEGCHKAFAESGNLKTHMKTHVLICVRP
jgi:uncharacterized Zn-finger protein